VQLHLGAVLQFAGQDFDLVGVQVTARVFLHVDDAAGAADPFGLALIAILAAALAIEGRGVEQNLGGLTR